MVDDHRHISAHLKFLFSGTVKCKVCFWYLMFVHVLSLHTRDTAFKQAKIRLYKNQMKWCNQSQSIHTHHVLLHHSQEDTKVNFSIDWKHFLDFVFMSWKSEDSQANLQRKRAQTILTGYGIVCEWTMCLLENVDFSILNRPISLWCQWSLCHEGQRDRKLSSCPSFASQSAALGFFHCPPSASGWQRQQLCENSTPGRYNVSSQFNFFSQVFSLWKQTELFVVKWFLTILMFDSFDLQKSYHLLLYYVKMFFSIFIFHFNILRGCGTHVKIRLQHFGY